jgi:hypothetical protein
MRETMGHVVWLIVCAPALAAATTGPCTRPLIHAHAHNDYQHPRPLLDALDCGFCSVEADIHLIDGRVLIAHDAKDAVPQRTLAALYLDPLKVRIAANGGRVYLGSAAPFTLLIDLKSPPQPTYRALRGVLEHYPGMLTRWRGGVRIDGPVTVILTGRSARRAVAAEAERLVACDGGLSDLQGNPSPELIPQISGKWSDTFAWTGIGAFPDSQRRALREIVETAHRQHRRVRFWDASDDPHAWKILSSAGVDLINTDNLPGLRDFLAAWPPEAAPGPPSTPKKKSYDCP